MNIGSPCPLQAPHSDVTLPAAAMAFPILSGTFLKKQKGKAVAPYTLTVRCYSHYYTVIQRPSSDSSVRRGTGVAVTAASPARPGRIRRRGGEWLLPGREAQSGRGVEGAIAAMVLALPGAR